MFREEFSPDGKRTHPEPQPLIYFNEKKKPARLEIQPALEKELAEAYYEQANPRRLRLITYEGLVTPLPLLPGGKYPDVRIKSDNWPTKDQIAEADDNAAGPAGMGPMAPKMPFGKGGFKGAGGSGGAGGAPPILGGRGSGPGPMGAGMGDNEPAADVPTVPFSLKQLEKSDKELYARLAEHRFNIFHPLGQIIPDDAPAAAAATNPPPGPMMPGGMPGYGAEQSGIERFGFGADGGATGGMGVMGGSGSGMPGLKPGGTTPNIPTGPGGANPSVGAGNIYDAIVRFVDVDVKPLYTYRYYIQVRLKNPNFGKRKDVAQQIFAAAKELRSDNWAPTPLFTVPGTYNLFAVDQFRVDHLGQKAEKDRKGGDKLLKKDHTAKDDQAVVQVHRWIGLTGEGYRIGDWAIKEWLAVRKGEQIGQPDMLVPMPTWNKGRGAFEMLRTQVKVRTRTETKKGVKLDFVPKVDNPPLLVDFEGGKRKFNVPNGGVMAEEAAMDLLILTPDGRLIVRNSRDDIDAEIYDGTPNGTTRQARVEQWRKRIRRAESGGAPSEGGGNSGAPSILPGR